jgi:hypothetical protein
MGAFDGLPSAGSARDLRLRGTVAGIALVLVATTALTLVLPGAARARRDPTPRERAAIARAAVREYAMGQLVVRTHDVRISTVGPWAAADVEIHRRGQSFVEQAVAATFYHAHGRWIVSDGIAAHDRAPSRAVERDLGLDASRSDLNWLTAYWLVCWFFGLAAIWDVLLQPPRAFRDAGHGKLRWLLVELLGAPFVGVFTWGWYAIRIRPAVVAAGGRPARTGLKAFLKGVGVFLRAVGVFLGALAAELPDKRSSVGRAPATPAWSVGTDPRCSSCGGSGKLECTHGPCHGGRIHVPGDGYNSPTTKPCLACGAQGWRRCSCPAGRAL